MNTHETYVSLETAKLLKEAEFDWSCRGYYDRQTLRFNFVWDHNGKGASTQCSAPTLDVAQRWLREVKGWDVVVDVENVGELRGYRYEIQYCPNFYKSHCIYAFNSYESALEAGINKCLEIILGKDEKV